MPRLSDDILLSKPVLTNLLKRFILEAEEEGGQGQHYAVIQPADGSYWEHNPYSPELDGAQTVFARDLLKFLNRELHHDGAWVIVFTHPKPSETVLTSYAEYACFALYWIDADGDVQFPIKWTEGEGEMFDFSDVQLAGRESWGNLCEGAWQQWHTLMIDVIDPREGQTYKKAQGQRPS